MLATALICIVNYSYIISNNEEFELTERRRLVTLCVYILQTSYNYKLLCYLYLRLNKVNSKYRAINIFHFVFYLYYFITIIFKECKKVAITKCDSRPRYCKMCSHFSWRK